MKSATNNYKRTRTMYDSDQNHHYYHHEDRESNEENVVDDDYESGHHIHHHHHFHYHHHHHHHNHNESNDNEERKPIVQPEPKPSPVLPPIKDLPSKRIHCMLNSNNFLSIVNGKLVLAPSDPEDNRQHWEIPDERVQCAFAMVNKATGQAIKHQHHAFGGSPKVDLVTYKPEVSDVYLLWVRGVHSHGGYVSLTPQLRSSFSLDGSTYSNARYEDHVGTSKYAGDSGQLWKFLSH